MLNLDAIKHLREHTGLAFALCREALEESGGDPTRALEILRARGGEIADKKRTRETREGRIEAYVHTTGKIAALIELQCETDFVAKNDLFRHLAHDLAMHVAAMAPANLDEFLAQEFIKSAGRTVAEHVSDIAARLGENVKVARFERWEM